MPTYEYMCAKCEHEFEREQRMSDTPVKTCPKCRSRRVKKLISKTSFVLKGGGWYSDLYSSAKDSKKDKGESESSQSSSDASSTDKGEKADKSSTKKDSKQKSKSGKSSGKKTAA